MWTAFLATILAPVVILALDYVYRLESDLYRLIQNSGPDLCLVSLGASVPVFLDARVVELLGTKAPGLESFAILGILLARGLCIRFNRQPPPNLSRYTGFACGMLCLLFVGAILVLAYWKAD